MLEQFLFLLICFCGLIIGLGAVTVIDLHGFLGRKSKYWTRATIQTHKVTKPLIWLGIVLFSFGLTGLSVFSSVLVYYTFHLLLVLLLVVNGIFLSFYVSPLLIKREKLGKADEILENALQNKIAISFIISVIGWWGSVILLAYELSLFLR